MTNQANTCTTDTEYAVEYTVSESEGPHLEYVDSETFHKVAKANPDDVVTFPDGVVCVFDKVGAYYY